MAPITHVKRVAVIGAGPGGAVTVDALAREKKFDKIRVFERRDKAGGIWIWDSNQNFKIPSLGDILNRSADQQIEIPTIFPVETTKDSVRNGPEQRFSYTPTYDALESNIDAKIMSYTEEPFPNSSKSKYGPDSVYRHREVIRGWVEGLFDRRGYKDFVSYSTTVERVEKVGKEWVVTLRKDNGETDYWWQETFDAVVVANGHYSVPFIPEVPGLLELEQKFPGTVEHSKSFRGPERYKDKRVIVVGASVSATDIARDLVSTAKSPVYASLRAPHPVLGFSAFEHPQIEQRPSIAYISTEGSTNTVHFIDGTTVKNIDHIIYGTGYIFSLPFLPSIQLDNRRLKNVYQHIWKQDDPTLSFVGAVSAGFTFRVFEYQAVAIARVLSGRSAVPPIAEQRDWEEKRVLARGNGVSFYKVAPEFEEYFETLRRIAGPATDGGRELIKWDPKWLEVMTQMMKDRMARWREEDDEARKRLGIKSSVIGIKSKL
ncbi:hypothetical protein PVAG01_07433 [Phlyctema vagabunda]|uniref:Flavin-containing monooxygenase n=1 Tax=Phlyctema vagabunda TaxID=108571 RepID=A0ABR4PCE6_9HELO